MSYQKFRSNLPRHLPRRCAVATSLDADATLSPSPPSTLNGIDWGCAASTPCSRRRSHPPHGRPPITIHPPVLLDAATIAVPNLDFFLDTTSLPPSSSTPRRSHRPCPVRSSLVLPQPRSLILLLGEPPTPCHFGSQMERNIALSSGEALSSVEIGITVQISLDSPLQAPPLCRCNFEWMLLILISDEMYEWMQHEISLNLQ
jgi:hypothetical protein